MNKLNLLFIICTLCIFGVSCFNYQEIQYPNNACTGNFVFKLKTTQCSQHGYIRKVNDTVLMVIPIKSNTECVESNDGSPKPSPTPTPTPSNNSTNNGTSTDLSSSSHNNSSTNSNELTSSSTHNSNSNNTSSDLSSSSSSSINNGTNSNNTSSDSTSSNSTVTNEPYTPPTYYKINECNVLPDGTSLFVTIQEDADEHPFKEMGFCNDIELLDNNCDYPQVRTYSNFTCIPLGKNDKGVAQFERISCRGNLQSIDYDYCLHDCTPVNCNYNYTKSSGVFLCPDIETIDTSNNNSANNLSTSSSSSILLLLSICIYFILYF